MLQRCPLSPGLLTAGVVVGAALLAPPAWADRLPVRAVHVVDYRIRASLDAEAKTVTGTQRLVWRNPSTDTVGELWFHLYLNAFRNSKSSFMRESSGGLRGSPPPDGGWGYIDVTSMRLEDGTELAGELVFEAPDDGNGDDRTLARVALPAPVAPGGSIALDIAFTAKLPRVIARTGYHGDFFLVAQWFPKVAVYEPAGRRGRRAGGWNAHQFHATTEFYADFGHYEVEITVPSRFTVGATGQRTATRVNPGGTTTYTYVQEDVHDFAWTADPRFVEVVDRFSAASEVGAGEYERMAHLLDRSLDELRLDDVEIRLLVQPIHQRQARRYLEAARHAIKWFGLWYGRYPYRTLTIVDPPPGGIAAGGMEYPTFITVGTSFVLGRWPLSGLRLPEEVTVHEFGHQYWYGLVASNEFEEAWLDEGLTSYSTAKVMDAVYGADRSVVDVLGLRLGSQAVARLQNSPWQLFERVRQPAWTYLGGYSFYSYTKPQLLLHTLERLLGEQTMARVMRTYHERWRFGHPSTDDFYAVANEVAGRDLAWLFAQAVEGTGVLDYEVALVSSSRERPVEGYVEGASGLVLAPKPDRDADRDTTGPWRSTVVVRRLGEVVVPVEIEFTFEGAPPERVAWDGRDPIKRWRVLRPERLLRAEIDPDRTLVLEADWLNNARRTDPDGRGALRWVARWWNAIQQAVASLAW